jgi:hypothetical protein
VQSVCPFLLLELWPTLNAAKHHAFIEISAALNWICQQAFLSAWSKAKALAIVVNADTKACPIALKVGTLVFSTLQWCHE